MSIQRLTSRARHTHTTPHEPVTVGSFLKNTAIYENAWTAPIDPRLRRALWLSLVAMIVGVVTAFVAPLLIENARSSGLLLEEFLVVWLGVMAALQVPLSLCTAVCMTGFHFFWKRTRGLRSGNWLCQRIATTVALYGALNAVAVGVPIFILALNLAALVVTFVVWLVWTIVQVVFWLIVIIAVLGALAS